MREHRESQNECCRRVRRGACASVSSARSSAHPAPLKLRIQATLDFRVNSAPSQLQRSARACQGQRSREMAWRVQWRVGSASAAHRRECESANGDHEASSETQAPASITALVPIDATDSPCGIILRRNRCRASAPAPEAAAGFAAPRNGCAAAALLAARSDRLVARLHRSRILMRIRC